ncbi:MAG: right-handed parallel beta-helix repeat-containing protein [Deltaproteobacteria bacterium]|nr:right-handed parallel beta-helix repeat-containing protein [Deltaproteobacteria bacterium]
MRKAVFLTLALPALLAPDLSLAATIRVPEDFKKIHEAVVSASSGDVVTVGPGVYSENILIKKPITLKSSSGADATVVIAAAKDAPVFSIRDTDGVTISGFTVRGSAIAGISIHNVTGSRIEGMKAAGNENGILVYSSSRNVFTGNSSEKNAQYGIYLEGSDGNIITGNSASSNGDKGIFLSSSNNNTLTDNAVNLNTWNGILLLSSHRNIVKDNKALRNTYGIISTDSDDSEFANNSVWPNLVIILPIILIYAGIAAYIIQRVLFRVIYRD